MGTFSLNVCHLLSAACASTKNNRLKFVDTTNELVILTVVIFFWFFQSYFVRFSSVHISQKFNPLIGNISNFPKWFLSKGKLQKTPPPFFKSNYSFFHLYGFSDLEVLIFFFFRFQYPLQFQISELWCELSLQCPKILWYSSEDPFCHVF